MRDVCAGASSKATGLIYDLLGDSAEGAAWRPLRGQEMTRGPYGIWTRVSTLRGWCPRPLDEGTVALMVCDGL